MLRRFFTILLLVTPILSRAQSVSTTLGARALGLAHASSCLSDDWSLLNNTGGLSQVKELTAGFAFETHPLLPGSSQLGTVINAPTPFGTAAIGMFRFGDKLYSEQVISAGFGNQFGIASLGLKVNYIQYRAEGYGTRSAFSVNFGGIAQLTSQLSVGAYITNINQPKISTADEEKIPTRLAAGLGFKPADQILIVTEVEKDIAYKPTWKAALEYKIHNKIFARTGFNLKPNAAFFGLGFHSWKIKVDYATQYSNSLNFYHQASAVYVIQKKSSASK